MTAQDGVGLVAEELVERAWLAARSTPHTTIVMRDDIVAALAAVAPDIAAQAKRECAEELRAAVRVARLRHRNGRTAGMMLAPFEFLTEEWSGSGRTPDGDGLRP